jgi:hypothetical protein
MKELIGIKKRVGVPFSLVTFIWASKRKSLADRAKTLLLNTKPTG